MSGFFQKFWRKPTPNRVFTDKRDRFRKLNFLTKEPSRFSFYFYSFACVVFAIIPLIFHYHWSAFAWIFWSLGLFWTVGLESGSNIHYRLYSKIANNRNLNNVERNVLCYRVLKNLAILGWVLVFLSIVMVVLSPDGTLNHVL